MARLKPGPAESLVMYDLIIIGGGPAGTAAAVYAARKKIRTLIITESFGGQSEVSADIQNWIGTKSITGFDLAKAFEEHVRSQEDITVVTGERAVKIEQGADKIYKVLTDDGGKTYQSRTIIITAGARRRKLGVAGEAEFNGRGVAYCATCDAPLFKGKVVAVVGGGNAGLESAIDLLPYASKIYLFEYGPALKGDPITAEKVRDAGVEIILNAKTRQILGDKENKFVAGLEYVDGTSGETKKTDLEGVFVEIGSVPNSEMVKDLIATNKYGEILIDHKTAATSREGIWAAGDVTDEMYKQNNISAGDGVKAALSVYMYLQKLEKAKE